MFNKIELLLILEALHDEIEYLKSRYDSSLTKDYQALQEINNFEKLNSKVRRIITHMNKIDNNYDQCELVFLQGKEAEEALKLLKSIGIIRLED